MKLSIIVPVYNEKGTILDCIARVQSVVLPGGYEKEIIIVDDGSTDGTSDLVKRFEKTCKVIWHEKNKGKGAAIRTALPYATGKYIVTQDADLEVDPGDLARMLQKMIDEDLTVLYGSRWVGKERKSYSSFSFYAGNILLSWMTNILYGQKITDEPTCYKMFRTDFLKSLPLRCERFEYCPEVTALTSLRGVKIPEIPISYKPRNIAQGKKIRWHDGLGAIWTLVVYRFRRNPYFYVLLLALAARLIFFFIALDTNGGHLENTIHGKDWYFEISRNLLSGNGFSAEVTPPFKPYSYGVPGYPYFLYFLLWISGGSYAFAAGVQILLGSFIPLIGMRLARHIVPYAKAPLFVGILLALAPYQTLFSFIFYTEALFTVLFGIFLIFFFNFLKKHSIKLALWSGLFLGLATLTKPTVQYLVVLAPLFAVWRWRKELSKELWQRLGVFALIFFIVLSPWLYRNYRTFGSVALSTQVAFNLEVTLLPSIIALEQDSNFNEARVEESSGSVIAEILSHPAALAKLMTISAVTFFTHDGMLTFLQAAGIRPASYLGTPAILLLLDSPLEFVKTMMPYMRTPMAFIFFARLFWIALTGLFFLGLWHLWRSKLFFPQAVFAALLVFYFMGTTMINGITVNARFRMPVEPLIFAIAYAGSVFIYRILKNKKAERVASRL